MIFNPHPPLRGTYRALMRTAHQNVLQNAPPEHFAPRGGRLVKASPSGLLLASGKRLATTESGDETAVTATHEVLVL